MKTTKSRTRRFAGILAGLLAVMMILPQTVALAAGNEEIPADPQTEEAAEEYVLPEGSDAIVPVTTPLSAASGGETGDHIYVPYELPEYVEDPLEPTSAEVSQPFYFAPGEGIGTPAKDQGIYGTCWAFSVVSGAESSLIAQHRTYDGGRTAGVTMDLSEFHTLYFFYNTETDPLNNMQDDRTLPVTLDKEEKQTAINRGGNNMFTSFALMAWKGMAIESLAPYSVIHSEFYKVDQSLAHSEAAHCQNFYWIDMNNVNLVKKMIIKYGSVVVAYNHNPYFYDSTNNSYYCPSPDYFIGGHSVQIVGWSDDYPKSNFSLKPNGDGAWIVKNSWGQNWGMQSPGARGMYWMSYGDTTLRKNVGVVLDYYDADNYDNNYQYDGTGNIDSISIPASKVDPTKISNQFEVKASDYERLDAVSVAFESAAVHYRVQIYKKEKGDLYSDPEQGTPLIETPLGYVSDYTGYITIPLEQEIVFERGDVYSIVISIWHASGSAGVFVDRTDHDYVWIDFINRLEYGQSWFAWGQNAEWAELSEYIFPLDMAYTEGYTLRIKGYTTNVTPVDYELRGLTVDGSEYARLEHSFTTKLVSDTELPESVDIFMYGALLTEGVSYTYDRTTGEITINNVNGPIEIHASVDTHEHVWNSGVITTDATCGTDGVKTYTCLECGETTEEPVPATGRHIWNAGVITLAPTSEQTGIRTFTCTVCGATMDEVLPVLPDELTVEKIGSYDVKITGLDVTKTYTVRYATGAYSGVSAVKNGTNAGFVQIKNSYEAIITLPTDGLHTLAVLCGSELLRFDQISIDTADLRDHLVVSAKELNLRVGNLVGANYVKLYRGATVIATVTAKNFSTDGLKTWADISVTESGYYTVRIVYSDGGMLEGSVELTAPAASVSANGRVFTVSDFGGAGNVSFMRLAKGTYKSASAIKAADDLRTYGAKYFRSASAAFAALDAVNGGTTTYTVQIGYASGYTEFITFDVTPTVPVITASGNTITVSNVYGIDWIRCAPGIHPTLYAIRHAFGSQVKKAADAVNGTITFTGVYKGNYSLYYLYDGWDLSEGLVTVTVN